MPCIFCCNDERDVCAGCFAVVMGVLRDLIDGEPVGALRVRAQWLQDSTSSSLDLDDPLDFDEYYDLCSRLKETYGTADPARRADLQDLN